MQMLHVNIAWPVIKAACGLVRNLANYEENHDVLVQLRVIPRLGQLLALACKEDRKVGLEPPLTIEHALHQSLLAGSDVAERRRDIVFQEFSSVLGTKQRLTHRRGRLERRHGGVRGSSDPAGAGVHDQPGDNS